MPTNKPRFTITTSRPVFETVSRMADLQGRSKSAVVNDLLEAVHPPLMRTVALLEAAQEAPERVKEGLRTTVLEMEREMAGSVGSGLAQMDWLLAQTTQRPAAEGAGAGALRAPAHATATTLQPPYTNRGVRNTKPTSKPPKRGSKNG